VRDATLDDVAAMAALELDVSGISRVKDYRYFIENSDGFWHVSVYENERGGIDGFLASIGHPLFNEIGPGVARVEAQAAALLVSELDQLRGRMPLLLVPVECAEVVGLCRLGRRNCEMHAAQVRGGRSRSGRGFPTFMRDGLAVPASSPAPPASSAAFARCSPAGDPIRALVRGGTDDSGPAARRRGRPRQSSSTPTRRAGPRQAATASSTSPGIVARDGRPEGSRRERRGSGSSSPPPSRRPRRHVSSVAAIGPRQRRDRPADETQPFRRGPSARLPRRRSGQAGRPRRGRPPARTSSSPTRLPARPWRRHRVSTWPVALPAGVLRVTVPGGLSFTDARDVAAGLVTLAARGRAGERTILTSREGNLSHADFFGRVGEVTGVRRRMIELPPRLAVLGARLVPWPVRPGEVEAAARGGSTTREAGSSASTPARRDRRHRRSFGGDTSARRAISPIEDATPAPAVILRPCLPSSRTRTSSTCFAPRQ
jgi:hypothetical protein